MIPIERFRKLAIKRGLTPGALLDASPEDFHRLLLSVRREFAMAREYNERDVNAHKHANMGQVFHYHIYRTGEVTCLGRAMI